MNDVLKKFMSLKESCSIINSVSWKIKNEVKKQIWGFLNIPLGMLGASLLGNLSARKGIKRSKLPGQRVMRTGEGTIKVGQNF